jgi:signal transduction histidine kinase
MTQRDSPVRVDPSWLEQAAPATAMDSSFETVAAPSPAARKAQPPRRALWRRRELLVIALLGCLGLLALLRLLAMQPYVDARWRADDDATVKLVSSTLPALQGLAGSRLQRITGRDGQGLDVDAGLLHRSPRWSVDDSQRQRQQRLQLQLASILGQGELTLHFAGGRQVTLVPAHRGLAGLGAFVWLLSATALALGLVTTAVLLAHPRWRNLPYAVISLSQGLNLLAMGIETLPGLGLPEAYALHGGSARSAFDLCSAAAMVHLSTLQPIRLPAGRWIAALTWGACIVVLALEAGQALAQAWWWTQSAMLGCGIATLALMTWSYRLEPNPFALLMRRLAIAATATLLLLSAAVAVASWHDGIAQGDASYSTVVWYLFLSTLILLLPMFSRAQPLMRELAMLTGTSSVATSLNLLFVATFSLGGFASLSLSVFFALAVYAGTRRWLLEPMRGQHVPGAERMFERLYRVLREVEARPRDSAELLTRLLRDLFEPLQVQTLDRPSTRSRVLGDGSALLVPLPTIDADHERGTDGSIVLRFAERGKRMFSRDDARLTDRVVEQLRRAVAYDKAVERGRSEERTRIAQDLHDDIGARLLTLMYKAQSPEMEDYIRHTLKDLKTLTRGLASSDQRLSHATAEWKADIGQRLGAAQIELSWTFTFDRDIVLGVVQWSALTRVLRELVSNAIQHSCATHLEITAALEGGRLRLTLADDGIGRNPQDWSHGLGLGGVRKRVKLLGGDVQWRENGRAGIVCTVLVPDLNPRP